MNRTKIEYLKYTWNPIVGCNGQGCSVRDHCWALGQSKRRKHDCKLCYEFTPHLHRERLRQPLRVKKQARIGVNFMGDTFDLAVHPDWQDDILQTITLAKWHTFVLLTKQPQNIPRWFDYETPDNLWLGVSVNTKADLWRIDTLRKLCAKIKVVSFEPLSEDLSDVDLSGIDWIIIGGQTRPKKLPCPWWVSKLTRKARDLGIPVFVKDNLEEFYWRYPSSRPQEIPEVRSK